MKKDPGYNLPIQNVVISTANQMKNSFNMCRGLYAHGKECRILIVKGIFNPYSFNQSQCVLQWLVALRVQYYRQQFSLLLIEMTEMNKDE